MKMMRLLMSSSAVFLAALGIGASFLPQELLARGGSPADWFTTTVVQLAGAAWVAFALVNWAASGTLIGGLYGRPIALGNFAHFAIGAIVLLTIVPRGHAGTALLAATALYAAFAAWFGYALFSAGPRATSRPA
jgi:hypothetical protein